MLAPAARQNDAVNVSCCPSATLDTDGDIELAAPQVIVTVAEALDAAPPVTALAIAWIVTGFVPGKSVGAA